MKLSNAFLILLMLQVILLSSCKKEDLFENPTIVVTGFTLKALPGEMTNIDVTVQITNNDKRDADIANVDYVVTVEGAVSNAESVDINQVLPVGTPVDLTLPLTLKTSEAVPLLAKLVAGEGLEYTVDGSFHLSNAVLSLFEIPVLLNGTAYVEAGFEEFYTQPEVTLDSLSGDYSEISGSYAFDFNASCTVENTDPRSVTIDEIEYVVYIAGFPSEKHLYSDSYSTALTVNGNGTLPLNLPVSFLMNEAEGLALAAALSMGTIDYTVEGTFHVTNLEGNTVDFYLPLYVEGSLSSAILGSMFKQPSVEVTGYTLLDLPGDQTHLNIDLIVTNNDSREVYIQDIVYTVDIEGVISAEETVVINQNVLPGTPIELTLPLTLVTSEAIELLTRLDAGEALAYHVTGTFHVDEPVLNLFDLPLDITGTANVEVGFEDFFEQPEITVNTITTSYSVNLLGGKYTFDMDVNCTVQNMDTRGATIDEVEYVVYVEGVKSATHFYSDTYDFDLLMAGNESKDLTLPVSLSLSLSSGATLVTALVDGSAEYTIEGTFHVTLVDGTTADFKLPLYDTGSAPVSVIQL